MVHVLYRCVYDPVGHRCMSVCYYLTGPCVSPCLNGGHCVHTQSCDCSLYQATGTHCQTVPNLGLEREMTCRSWGQYNYETFDGLYYHFPGKCTYTLLRDCEDNAQGSVIVQVHNDPECRSSPYSCTRSVSLFLPWEGEIRLHRSKVTFKGQSVQLPHHIHDVELERISGYVLVTQQHGFTLAWDGHSGSVYVKLSPEWVGRACGLCGNFNADLQDDLKTSYGVVTEDLAVFGNSWVEEEPHHSRCPMTTVLFPQKVKEVCAMLLEQPFTACHEFVSPLSYMASCSNDLCLSDEVCQVLTEYARACAHADHPLLDWRTHIPQCVCPAELQYKECITCCPATCNMDRMCIDSKLQCLDGCYCPDELIYEEGKCVKASECPCEYHGMIYPSGQSVQEECNNCTCKGGVWNCTEYSCPGECSVTGDMYFHSFDGRMFTFPASCQYVLAKSHNSGKFTVTIQNAPCGPNLDGACIQSVSLVIDEDPRTEITMSHLGEVFMAGQYRISLPYSDEVFHIQELSSMFLQVRTAPGLHLQYSWREFRLYLQVDELWKGNTVGLCGTFNGNIQDDFLSPSGMIESTPHLFGNAWKVSSACVPSHSVPQMDPCDTHQQAASYASEMCDILNQELFSSCHGYLSPVPFHQQCLSDTCKCGQPCLCSSLAHYARHCRRYSVIIQFRASVPDCAVTCPETMEYGTCVSSCQRRCSALSTQQHCGEECEEGCVCPPGTFYSTRTHTYKQCPLGQTYVDCVEGLSPGGGLGCEHTCESHLLNLTCSAHEPCVPGCVCPHGLLKHGDECFEPDACPCLWKGKEYYPGDKVTSPCHHCVCQHGTFQCVFRPCPSMCTTYGDRHYRTFDGLLFDYVGACKVYLVKSSGDLMMSVMAENVDCYDSGVICRKSLLINIGRSFIAFDDDSGKPNPSSVMDRKQEVFIWSAGYFTVVHVPEEDLTVLWDHKTTVHIQAGARWQGKLSGLCGNFDQRTVNEMRTPENIDSATPQEFGNSWTAAECVNSPDTRHPCTLNPLREPFAKRQCGVLLSEVFQVCHPVVDVTWFYTNCLADTCGCSRGGDCECFCTSVAAYAHRCCHQGVAVDWRSPSTCLLGKGPYRLVTYREKSAVLAANRSSGTFNNQHAFPPDTSLVSFEASKRPNYFLVANRSGHVRLSKWDESEAFWDAATFVLHRDTWIQGYVSLEAFTRPRFFLHFTSSWIHLMKYKHTDGFRKATLFKLTGDPTGPRCQWRYESCVSPCFRTCSDPSRTACVTIPKVEGCQPLCPDHMVLDEVTQRCVHTEDCEPVTPEPLTTMVSTTTVPPLPGVDTTTIRPVTIRPLTETTRTPPDTGRVEVSTATTQQPTSSWSGPITTTPFTSTTTRPERVTTRVVSSTTAPATTRTTRPERVTTRVISSTTAPATTRTTRPKTTTHRTTTGRVPTTTSRATATVRSTGIPPSTDRVTIAMRPTVVPTTSVRATMKPVTTARTTEYPADVSSTVSTSETTTTAASSVPIPSLTVVTLSTAVPAGKTTVAEPAKSTTPVERIETSSTRVTPTAKEPTTTRTPVPGLVTSTEVGATPGVKPKVTTEFTPAVPATASVPALPTTATPASTAVTDGVDRVSPYTTPERTPSPSPVSPYTTPEKTPSLSPVSPYTTPEKTPSLSPVSPYTTPEKTPSLSPVSPYTTPEKTPSLSPVSPYTTPEKTPSLSPVSPYTKPEKTPSLSPVSPYTTPEKTPSLSPVSPYTTPEKTPSLSPVSPYTTPEKTPSLSPVSPYTTPEKTPSLSPVSPYTTPEKTLSPSSVSPHTTPEKTPSPSSVSPHTTPEKTPSPSSVSPHTTPESIEPPAKATTTMAVSSTRMCTPPYSEMVDECTKNICVSGQLVMFNKSQNCPYDATPPNCGLLGFAILVNGDKCCPQWDCPCRCSVFPDLNVITFDGNSVAVYKAASYIVSQLPNETISVVVQEYSGTALGELLLSRLQRRVSLLVNCFISSIYSLFGFEVLDTGNMYLIRTPAGLSLQWFHSTGMMVIETESYDNKLPTMGLCGHCDGNPANDLMLSNGTTIGEGEDPALFIDSWQVPNTTSYVSQSRRREVNCTTSDCSRCLDMLQNTSFSPCHAFVPVSTFCEVWVRDAEYVNNPCVALAAYVASCHKFNVCIEWRSPDYCPFICPEELRYQACLPGCTAQSCSNHDFDYNHVQCSGLTEGCVCPEGTLLHRPYSALCVPQEKCACTDSSGVPHAHGEVWKASKDGCCMYRCDNDSVVPVEYNCSAVPQPLCRRAGEVIVGLADDASCCPRRVCVCNQTLCDVFPPECQYGEKLVSYFREDSCCPDYACECDPERCELDIPACRDDQTLIATRADGSCCLAHICMCAACSDVVPECQNGEVLTVDFNSTDRCCPIYHCVCEPYRCAEITCPLGMSAVSMSTPERCCPQYTCECACDKMSSPKCSLVGYLREAVCVYGERGVMHPGQTLVEHGEDGVCLTTQCTRSLDQTTGFHRLRTTTSNCSAHCQPNQIYIPPKDQTSCCGVCKNISCLYQNKNGTAILYKPGKSWVSNCTKYECTDTLSGPTLVSYSFSCPPFNETDCMKIGGTVVSYMDGCCKTCKEDGKACQKVTVRMTIRKNDCRSNRPVNIVSCDGKCPSASIYNYNINTYARFCKCCREMGLQRRSVPLYCNGNSTWVSYSVQEPTDCSCQWS
uniref:Otogelin n=1 Tax=Esox lucius TaxID=8010 RepID=A0A6Q2ZQM3_ESOLU